MMKHVTMKHVLLGSLLLLGLPLPGNAAHAEKHALLVGVGVYKNPKANLPGIDKDIAMAQQIAIRQGFKPENTLLLRDDQATLGNMRQALGWLAKNTAPNDEVFIYVSSHGSHIRDRNGDEDDGQDETLYLHDGHLIDDELHVLLSRIPSRYMRIMVDACHSGTGTRTVSPNRYRVKNGHIKSWVEKADYSPASGYDLPAVDVLAPAQNYVAIAAAQDNQQSLASDDGSVFTRAVLDVVEEARDRQEQPSWQTVFNRIRQRMGEIETSFTPNLDGNLALAQEKISFVPLNTASPAYYPTTSAFAQEATARPQGVALAAPALASTAMPVAVAIKPATLPAVASTQPVTLPGTAVQAAVASGTTRPQPVPVVAMVQPVARPEPVVPVTASVVAVINKPPKPSVAVADTTTAMPVTPASSKPAVPLVVNTISPASISEFNLMWQEVAAYARHAPEKVKIRSPVYIQEQQLLNFTVDVPKAGYLYIVSVGPTDNTTLLSPNQLTLDRKVMVKTVAFPEAGKFVIRAGAPLGKTMLAAFLSPVQLNWQDQAFGNKDNHGEISSLFGKLPLSAIRDLGRLKSYAADYMEVDIQPKQ